MVALALSLSLADAPPPVMPVGEKDLFHLPKPEEVRMQRIERQPNEKDWPFTVDRGVLSCVYSAGRPVVAFFGAGDDEDEEDGDAQSTRFVLMSTNPIELVFGNMAHRDLFRKVDRVEDLIAAVAPFVELGQRLCNQPKGEILGSGEL